MKLLSLTSFQRFWILLFTVISCFLYYKQTSVWSNGIMKIKKCGIIQEKLRVSESNSKNTELNEYFIMAYDDGSFQRLKVGDNTYYGNKQYDRVCFTFDTELENSRAGWIVLSIICYIICIFGFLCGFAED